MEFFIGIEIGGTKLQLVTGTAEGKILERRRSTVDRTLGAAGIQRQIELALSELTRDIKPAAVGVGFGGPVDWKTGKVCQSHHIKGWSNFDLRAWLEQLTHVQVFVDNDANVAALGEARFGAGIGFDPVFYVTLGSGVGGGLAVDGEIYHGTLPGESEIGHVQLDRSGMTVESQCSGWAVDAKIRAVIKAEPRSLLAKLSKGTVLGEARFLGPAFSQGDVTAAKLVRETAENLAFALSHVVHLFHPEIIVIGGGLSNLGEPLRDGVESALRGFIMGAFLPGPRIAISTLGEDAVPVGTLRLAQGRSPAPSDSIT
jgi:glucokinase